MVDAYLINLAHREDRRSEFVSHWESVGLGFDLKIIEAVLDENFGGLGCAKSHILALTDFIARGSSPYCMIMEDDLKIDCDRTDFERCMDFFFKSSSQVFLLSGTSVVRAGQIYGDIEAIFESATTAGYIVKREYVKNILSVFIDSTLAMEKYRSVKPRELIYGRFAIDQVWKYLQRQGGWCARIPMMGRQVESFSDIEKRIVDYAGISS